MVKPVIKVIRRDKTKVRFHKGPIYLVGLYTT